MLVQVNDPKYIDHELEIKALQILDDNVVKIVVSTEPDEYSTDKKRQEDMHLLKKDSCKAKNSLLKLLKAKRLMSVLMLKRVKFLVVQNSK